MCGMAADLIVDIADDSRENPEYQHVVRQLKAGERVLTEVRREKNNLQDANTKLSMELKDVRAQLADSKKENNRLRCGIFSKCLNEPLIKGTAEKPANRVMSVGMLMGRPAEEMPGSAVIFYPSSHNCTNKSGR